jgi:hypothetical protein
MAPEIHEESPRLLTESPQTCPKRARASVHIILAMNIAPPTVADLVDLVAAKDKHPLGAVLLLLLITLAIAAIMALKSGGDKKP